MHAVVETFVRGFAYTRGLTHPYLADRTGKYWRLHDAPRRDDRYRNEEWIGYDPDPTDFVRRVRRGATGRYMLTAIHSDDGDHVRAAYREFGLRLIGTEAMMTRALTRIPRRSCPVRLARVTTTEQVHRLNRAARRRQLLPEHLDAGSPLLQYIALDGDTIVGWVQSIAIGPMTWCSNMFVQPGHRRRGIAGGLLAMMLRGDRRRGVTTSVLQASSAGDPVYRRMGYGQIGTTLLYVPRRS